jgi:hypothetical protein
MHEEDGRRVKLYGIAAEGERPRSELVDATVAQIGRLVPAGGVGFAIAHDAADACFALFDWFANGNEIHQQMLSADLDRPQELAEHRTRAIGCVWELAVTDHERRAWLRHVLANPGGPDLDAYLADSFEADV